MQVFCWRGLPTTTHVRFDPAPCYICWFVCIMTSLEMLYGFCLFCQPTSTCVYLLPLGRGGRGNLQNACITKLPCLCLQIAILARGDHVNELFIIVSGTALSSRPESKDDTSHSSRMMLNRSNTSLSRRLNVGWKHLRLMVLAAYYILHFLKPFCNDQNYGIVLCYWHVDINILLHLYINIYY